MKAFVSSQFSYCPLIWMFHSRKMGHRINSIHNRSLKLVYQDSHDLRFQDKSVSVHQKNLQLLATEIFKSKTGMSLELINDTFHFVERPYNSKFKKQLYIRKETRSYCLSRPRVSFFTCSQIVRSSTKLNKKFCFSQGIQNKS